MTGEEIERAEGENTLHPLEIQDARNAAHMASELQKGVEDALRNQGRELADAERKYRRALSKEILRVHVEDGMAITMCGEIARGDETVSQLRYERDIAKARFKAVEQQAYRYGADRRDLDTMLEWSMRRDLRTEAPPDDWRDQPTFGMRRPELQTDPETGLRFDPDTGQVEEEGEEG